MHQDLFSFLFSFVAYLDFILLIASPSFDETQGIELRDSLFNNTVRASKQRREEWEDSCRANDELLCTLPHSFSFLAFTGPVV